MFQGGDGPFPFGGDDPRDEHERPAPDLDELMLLEQTARRPVSEASSGSGGRAARAAPQHVPELGPSSLTFPLGCVLGQPATAATHHSSAAQAPRPIVNGARHVLAPHERLAVARRVSATESRKAGGEKRSLTPDEIRFVRNALPALARRVAHIEGGHDPQNLPEITRSDLR